MKKYLKTKKCKICNTTGEVYIYSKTKNYIFYICDNCSSSFIKRFNSLKSPRVEKPVEIQDYETTNGVFAGATRMHNNSNNSVTHSDSFHNHSPKEFKQRKKVLTLVRALDNSEYAKKGLSRNNPSDFYDKKQLTKEQLRWISLIDKNIETLRKKINYWENQKNKIRLEKKCKE